MTEMPYPVAPDGRLHYCDPPFEAHSFVLANGSNVAVAVSDGYATWVVTAGDTAGAGLPSGARSLLVQSAGVGQGPVTLYAREGLDAGSKLAQAVSGSISAAITNAITAAVTGTVTADVGSGTQPVSGTIVATLPAESQIDSRSFASIGAKSYTVNLPAGTRGVILDIGSNTHGLFHGLTIVGASTGILYYGDNTAPLSDQFPVYMPIVVPVFSSVDSAVTVAFAYDSTTGSTWLLYALTGDVPPTLGAQAAQIVREHPPALTASGFAMVDTPAANAVLVDSGALPAGDYRVEFELFGTAPNAAYIYIRAERTNAVPTADHVTVCPSPFAVPLTWSRIPLVANGHFRIVAGPVIWPASVGGGALRVYRLT